MGVGGFFVSDFFPQLIDRFLLRRTFRDIYEVKEEFDKLDHDQRKDLIKDKIPIQLLKKV